MINEANIKINLKQINEIKKYYLNEENNKEKIISIIKLSDGLPCLNFSEKNWKAYHSDEKVKNETCSSINGKITDDRYEKFDKFQTTKLKLYTDNNIFNI